MRKFILLLFLLCVSCTKPLGEEDPLDQPSTEAPGAFNLATIQRFDHQLLVSWSTSKGASSYELKYGTAAGTYTQSIKSSKSPVVIESGLVPGTTYYFRVTASNDIGTVDSSSEKSYPYMGAPGEFSLLTVIPGNNQVALTWDASPEASSYTVMYGTSSGSITTSAGNSLTTAKTVSSLDNGTTYYFSVIAKNSVGNVTSTNTLSATPSPPPSAPLNLAATAASTKCTLTWEAPATGTAPFVYTVRRVTGPGTDVAVCTNTPLLACEETIAAGNYDYTVEATNASGTGAKSSAVSCAVGLPGAFQMLTATPGDGRATLTWEASNLATAYTVRYGTSVGAINTVASTSATSPYIVTGLTNMVPYYFSVTATNAVGSKLSTNTLTATPNVPPTVPLTPTVTVSEVGKCTLNWMPPASGAPPITYTVKRVVNPSVKVTICENIATRTCSEEGLSSATYNYTIEAINSVGTSPATANIPCTLGAPSAPASLAVTAANKKATLTWGATSGAASFTVKYGTVNPPTTVASTTATSPYEITGLTNGVLQYFRVEAVNPYGATPATVNATPTSTAPTLTWTGLQTTTIATMSNTTTRNFTIADPDPEDTVDCASSVTATTSDPSIVPQGNIVLGGSGLNCTIAITPAAGSSGFATISVVVSDGQATSTTNLSVYRLPAPQRIYSWKKYGSYSGPAIRIRRTADNAEADIYFDANGVVNKTAFDTFRAGGTPTLVKWYDQSGSGIDAVQTVAANQPTVTIATGGILNITTATAVHALTVPNFPAATANTVYMNFRYTQDSTLKELFSYGTHEAGSRSGFHLTKNTGNTGAWLGITAADGNNWETTTGAASVNNSERGLALVINTSTLKRDLVISTAGPSAAATRYAATMTAYSAPAGGTSLHVFAGGTAGASNPIRGITKELLIWNQELANDQIKALATQNN